MRIVGMNFGMYGEKCQYFDVGGRLRGLWERCCEDCSIVIFCWKLGKDPDKHDGDESDDPQSTYIAQLNMLKLSAQVDP
jgi:hypothetical protein